MPKQLFIASTENSKAFSDIEICKEFVSVKRMTYGLSPFQPDKVLFSAARIFLNRIDDLLSTDASLVIEPVSSKNRVARLSARAEGLGYTVVFVNSVQLTGTLDELVPMREF